MMRQAAAGSLFFVLVLWLQMSEAGAAAACKPGVIEVTGIATQTRAMKQEPSASARHDFLLQGPSCGVEPIFVRSRGEVFCPEAVFVQVRGRYHMAEVGGMKTPVIEATRVDCSIP